MISLSAPVCGGVGYTYSFRTVAVVLGELHFSVCTRRSFQKTLFTCHNGTCLSFRLHGKDK